VVTVKSRLKDVYGFLQILRDIGMEFGAVYWQHDRVFAPKVFGRGRNLPRLVIRTEMKAVDKPAKYYLILKRHIEDKRIDVVNKIVVKDYVETARMLHQLGFVLVAEVSRQRQDLVMGEDVKMHLDRVEGLTGWWAKLESRVEEGGDAVAIWDDLVKTFEVLGQGREGVSDMTYRELVGGGE
jgi:adenylate cyclase class IV